MDFNFIKEQLRMSQNIEKLAYEAGYKQGFEDGQKKQEDGYASVKDATESEQVEKLEAKERELKEEDMSDILYEMKRDQNDN